MANKKGEIKGRAGKRTPRASNWKSEPVSRAMDQLIEQRDVVRLAEEGIAIITRMPGIMRGVARTTGRETLLQGADDLEAGTIPLAKGEMDRDFYNLRSLAIIGTWSILENLVKDLVTAWIKHDRSVFKRDAFKKVSIPLPEYMSTSPAERASLIADLVEQRLSSSLRVGVGRFNSLLDAIGLHAALSNENEKSLLEMQQVRNVIAHRGGMIDRRLKAACPWVKQKIGQKVSISSDDYSRYWRAVHEFVLQILYSIGDSEGTDLRVEPTTLSD